MSQPSPPDTRDMRGIRVGHYEIVSEIGRGGMGVVYRARDLKLGRHVALKCPLGRAGADPRFQRRFLSEARAAARLAHPNVVPVFEVLEEGGAPWLAMELVDGTTLRGLLDGGTPLPLQEVLVHAEGLASALAAAHARGIVHRDVNPNNIMVTRDGRACLADFGMARVIRVSVQSSTDTRETPEEARGGVAGTPHYMSPEQALGKEIDARSDLFSLGTVLYEMCTGRRAFPGRGGDALDALLNHEPTPVSRLNYEIPDDLERIIRKALAKRPEERYQDARDLLADLRRLRRQVEHPNHSSEERTAPLTRNRRLQWVTGGALLAAALAGALVATSRKVAAPIPHPDRVRLAVLPYQDATRRPEAAGWPELVQALFVQELTGVEELGVVDPLTVNGILDSRFGTRQPSRGPELLSALQATASTVLIDGVISMRGEGYQIRTHVIHRDTGELRLSEETVIQGEALLAEAVAGQSRQVLRALNVETATEDKDLQPWLLHRPRNLEALKAFLQAVEYALRYEPGSGPHLDRALRLDPNFISPRLWMISGAVADGSLAEARQHLDHLRGIESTASPFEQALIAWADALIAEDHARQARHLQFALRYSPDNNILLVTLAEARLRMGDLEGALAALDPALKIRWRYPNLYALQGICLLGLERYVDATAALKDALAVTPVDPHVYGMLLALALREGNDAEAARYRQLYFARAREMGIPPAGAYDDLSAHMIRVGLHEHAAEVAKEAFSAGLDTAHVGYLLTDALFESAAADASVTAYSKDLAKRPAFAAAHLMLGRIADARSQNAEAIRHYSNYLSHAGSSDATRGVRQRITILRSLKGTLER